MFALREQITILPWRPAGLHARAAAEFAEKGDSRFNHQGAPRKMCSIRARKRACESYSFSWALVAHSAHPFWVHGPSAPKPVKHGGGQGRRVWAVSVLLGQTDAPARAMRQ